MKKTSMFALAMAVILTYSVAVPAPVFASVESGETETTITAEAVLDLSVTYEEELLTLINTERMNHGLPAYILDETVDSAAEIRILELESVFSHKRDGGKHFSSILNESGISYSAASETIAAGQTTPEKVFDAWMASSRHCSRILSSEYTKVGLAHSRGTDGTDYWEVLYLNE